MGRKKIEHLVNEDAKVLKHVSHKEQIFNETLTVDKTVAKAVNG